MEKIPLTLKFLHQRRWWRWRQISGMLLLLLSASNICSFSWSSVKVDCLRRSSIHSNCNEHWMTLVFGPQTSDREFYETISKIWKLWPLTAALRHLGENWSGTLPKSKIIWNDGNMDTTSTWWQRSFFKRLWLLIHLWQTENMRKMYNSIIFRSLREAPLKLASPLFGHCPNSNWTPLPALKRALWGTFFPGRFERLCQITVLRVCKCHKESWQALNPLLTKENT